MMTEAETVAMKLPTGTQSPLEPLDAGRGRQGLPGATRGKASVDSSAVDKATQFVLLCHSGPWKLQAASPEACTTRAGLAGPVGPASREPGQQGSPPRGQPPVCSCLLTASCCET